MTVQVTTRCDACGAQAREVYRLYSQLVMVPEVAWTDDDGYRFAGHRFTTEPRAVTDLCSGCVKTVRINGYGTIQREKVPA